MRIIAGLYKGRTLETVRDLSIRPATERVKGTIFNMLQNRLNLNGVTVLDLFAGSGNLGFEALSRGASHVVFVDAGDESYDAITVNAEKLGCKSSCSTVLMDAIRFLDYTHERFNLIFADPPYSYQRISELPLLIFERKLLEKKGFLIIEHSKKTTFGQHPLYSLMQQREFGNTRLSFFIHSNEEDPLL
jgi:16S rRNA (guanine(966)-N(2))-methyltransferase RsmD